MADHSMLAVLFVSLFIFVFFKYCLGDEAPVQAAAAARGAGLDGYRHDNVTRTVLQHVLYDQFAGSANAQLQFV
ncbi:Hypothetical protein CINCED_3A022073 [Cinara cedri]|uniref:Uncharacterized protein n=1 Tax=Cinara cedri TaxID=506608 RepID=A0A5E4NRQ4_9HEMI|nr:Hypothetical protein CINCED_3A022073 [Cinara cedri]